MQKKHDPKGLNNCMRDQDSRVCKTKKDYERRVFAFYGLIFLEGNI